MTQQYYNPLIYIHWHHIFCYPPSYIAILHHIYCYPPSYILLSSIIYSILLSSIIYIAILYHIYCYPPSYILLSSISWTILPWFNEFRLIHVSPMSKAMIVLDGTPWCPSFKLYKSMSSGTVDCHVEIKNSYIKIRKLSKNDFLFLW